MSEQLSKEWFKYYNHLNEKKKELKELKKHFDELSNTLQEFMLSNSIDTIIIDNKKICLKETHTFSSINKESLVNSIQEYIDKNNPKTTTHLAENMSESIMNNRTQKTKTNLRVSKK